jgi:hypothetical protein
VLRKRLSGDDLIEHPANRGAAEISALNPKANDPTCEYVHHHHDPMAAQEDRFAAKQIDAPQAVLHMPDKAQPGRAIGSSPGSIVLREHAADDVLVDIDAKSPRNLLGDAGTASTGIAALERDDRVDELLRWLSLLKNELRTIVGDKQEDAASPISRGATLIAMMQAADLREGDNVMACGG